MNEQLPIRREPHPEPPLANLPAPYRGTVPAVADRTRLAVSALRRRWPWFLLVFVVVLAGVAAFTLRQTPQYTATASLLVNSRVLNVAPKDNDIVPEADAEDRAVNAEIQVLQSNAVAERVIARVRRSPALIEALELEPTATSRAILGEVKQRTRVERPGATNVLDVSFTAADPEIAANVANAFAREYIGFKVDGRLDAARDADTGLRGELDALRGRVEEAEAAVARYRRDNNLLSSDGVTLTERDQSLFRQQEAAARTALAEEQARLNTARAQLRHGSAGDDVGEALGSPVVNQLRGQRSVVSARLAELEARYQPSHPKVVNTREELRDVDTAIAGEIARVVSNLEARVSVAQQRLGSISGVSNQARGELAVNAAASVRLNELERRADALRTNYAGMLARQTAVASQAVVADVDARLLSAALTPEQPSAPNRKLNLALGGLLALLLAGATVALLQLFDQKLVSSRQVEAQLGLRHLINVPTVRSIARRGEQKIAPADYVLDRPLSLLAESMRSLLLELDQDGEASGVRIVGVASARPGEGKSTVAVCLARVSAISGRRTLLIDGDIRRPGIAPLLGLKPRHGLIDVLSGAVPLKDAVLHDARSGAWVLPALAQPYAHSQISSEAALRSLMTRFADVFDVVVVDTAPALAAVESRLLMNHVHKALMVVRWKHTTVSVVKSALRRLYSIGVRPIGVVMTRVDMRAIAAYAVDDVDHQYRAWGNYD